MKRPLIDHLWSKMPEGHSFGREAVKDKLTQLGEIEEAIRSAHGQDAVENVLGAGGLRRALERMDQIYGGDSMFDDIDLHVFYEYATWQAKESQMIIDDELADLGL